MTKVKLKRVVDVVSYTYFIFSFRGCCACRAWKLTVYTPSQPAPIQQFIDKILGTPDESLADVLDGFSWQYEKVRARSLLGPMGAPTVQVT